MSNEHQNINLRANYAAQFKMPKPALCISDKMLMSFNGWNPELLNMNHGQNIVSIMSRFTCKKNLFFV